MKLQMVAKSDVGKVREVNEDFCGIFQEEKLALVCDGMGGHKAGSQASRLAVSTIRYAFSYIEESVHQKITVDMDEENQVAAGRLVSSIRLANRHVFNRACREPEFRGMGTTVSAISFDENGHACIVHVGDSRVYRIRDNIMEQITEDHSWLNELIQDQEINKEDAVQFEKKNVITRALGLAEKVKIDVQLEPVKNGDVFLLCSDGLTDALTDNDIQKIIQLNSSSLQRTAAHLINSANIAGGPDNISVVLVKVENDVEDISALNSISLSLKVENEIVSTFENRILRREFNNKGMFSSLLNKASEIWEQKVTRISVAAAAIVLLGVGVHRILPGGSDSMMATPVQLQADEIEVTKQIANNRFRNSMKVAPGGDGALTEDSTHNPAPKNRNTMPNELIQTKPLTETSTSVGQIFLLGVENIGNYKDSFIYLNDRVAGKTVEFLETGLRVRPGLYRIAIKDINQTTLYQYASRIRIVAGDIKAIEIR
ncbi:Stp1/IreP family PP2C-type Ser/Thr phosphatase [candidate division KSB1 bacterium]|nr:Stp1/IreP family PP2C-type Ser/Thr phosphatase [candidate division KSB1 bacterium]